jgi:exosortase H (IPTLxxWG-CTERM-specific)
VLLFALFVGIGFALVLAPPLVPGVDYLTRGIAGMCAKIILLAGGHIQVTGQTLRAPDTGFSMMVVYGCNGINVVVLLWSAVLAWPTGRWTDKLKGMLLGALVIQSANTLRIISLFYLGQWNRAWFEWMHLYVWEIVIMLVGLAAFGVWIRRTPASAVADPAK